jgi:hypothetical protein
MHMIRPSSQRSNPKHLLLCHWFDCGAPDRADLTCAIGYEMKCDSRRGIATHVRLLGWPFH